MFSYHYTGWWMCTNRVMKNWLNPIFLDRVSYIHYTCMLSAYFIISRFRIVIIKSRFKGRFWLKYTQNLWRQCQSWKDFRIIWQFCPFNSFKELAQMLECKYCQSAHLIRFRQIFFPDSETVKGRYNKTCSYYNHSIFLLIKLYNFPKILKLLSGLD